LSAPFQRNRRVLRLHSYEPLQQDIAPFLGGSRGESLVIAPARGVAGDLLLRQNAGAAAGVHRFTLNQLAAVAAAPALALDGKKPANRLATEALAARVVHVIGKQAKWEYFGPVAATPGFTRALASTLIELRMNSVTPQALAVSAPPARDLATCLEMYIDQIGRSDLADIADIYRCAAAASHRYLALPLLLYDVPLNTVLARNLASALVAKSPDVLACTLAGDGDECARLESMLGVRASDEQGPAATTTIGRVRSYVFSPQLPRSEQLDDSAGYFSAPGEAMECVEIARRIHALADTGAAFDRIAILLRHPGRYQPLVEEALRRASIPAYFSRGVLRPDPAGRAFLALLACAIEECSASRFAEYLSLGQVPREGEQPRSEAAPLDDEVLRAFSGQEAAIAPESGETESEPAGQDSDENRIIAGTLQTPAAWEELIINASVIGGASRWERRLKGLENELIARAAEAADSGLDVLSIRTQIERLRNLESFALPLIRRLDELPESTLWGDYIEVLGDLARAALRKPASVLSVLAELAPMAEVGPVRLEEVFHVLAERLRTLRRDPPGRRYGRVFVGSIEEARGRWFTAVFLPGLAEGMFPAKVAEDPLLLDTHRAAISSDLDTNKQRREQERLLLRIALAAGEKIVFSYPRIDLAQSRPKVPSFYALEIIRSAYGRLPGLHEFQSRAAANAPTRLDRPAPGEFADAIDDTEYDLVALEKARADGHEQEGALRYLVSVNAALHRSLTARYQRWELHKWTAADGLLESSVLPGYGLTERAYSPTALQQFSACPYRFALHGIFKLRPRDSAAPLYQMDALTRGALFHDVQRDLFRSLESEGLLPVNPAEMEKIRAIADGVLDTVASEYADRLAPAIPRVWRSEIEEIRTDIHGWLPYVAAGAEWMPTHFELAFGLRNLEGRDAASTHDPAVILGGLRVAGSIDLVERHRTRNVFRVIDHKTGKAPERKQPFVGGGATLQPLVYALAAAEILGAPAESGALFYCTQRGNFEFLPVQVHEPTVKWLRRTLEIIDSAIARGDLRAAPDRDACQTCEYTSVCGPYEAQRLRRKSRTGLEDLDELRSMP
jgi:ATP-dependent helicase/nuclease subunit B